MRSNYRGLKAVSPRPPLRKHRGLPIPAHLFINSKEEEERGVSLVDNLEILPLEEVAHLGLSRQDQRGQLLRHFLLLLFRPRLVPLL